MTNRTRAARASAVVQTYGEEPGIIEPTVIDLMTDIMHYIRFDRGITKVETAEMFAQMALMASIHFDDEVRG